MLRMRTRLSLSLGGAFSTSFLVVEVSTYVSIFCLCYTIHTPYTRIHTYTDKHRCMLTSQSGSQMQLTADGAHHSAAPCTMHWHLHFLPVSEVMKEKDEKCMRNKKLWKLCEGSEVSFFFPPSSCSPFSSIFPFFWGGY